MLHHTSASLHEKLQASIDKLLAHPLYHHVNTLPRLRIFMREHAFAVWDFMTLLKRLQQDFCGTTTPWTPPAQPALARFINEIVLAEESDTDGCGGFASHCELYLSAMDELGAETAPVLELIRAVRAGESASDVLKRLSISPETIDFVNFNIRIAQTGTPWEVAAVFCYGREDVIPEMFERLLKPLQKSKPGSERFEYYLRRHIELDGDEHGPLSQKLLATLIAGKLDREQAALIAGAQAIEHRIRLWDGIDRRIREIEAGSAE